MVLRAIRDDDPDSVVHAAITGGSSAHIKVSGSISGNAQDAIDKFKSENPHVERSAYKPAKTRGSPGGRRMKR